MEPYVHTLNRNEHLIFLNEKRIDPVTGERITDGDRIVICSRCKTAHLLHSWNDNGQKCPIKDCESESTLNYIPHENYDLQFEKSDNDTFSAFSIEEKEMVSSKSEHQDPLIFISHDSNDSKLATLVKMSLEKASHYKLEAFCSGAYNIPFGAKWYPQIIEKINRASAVLCILTKNSLNRPWILYEAGLAEAKIGRRVLGIAFGVTLEDIGTSSPFSQFQNCEGTVEGICELTKQLFQKILNFDNPDDFVIKSVVRKFFKQMKPLIENSNDVDISFDKLYKEIKNISNNLLDNCNINSQKLNDFIDFTFKLNGEWGFIFLLNLFKVDYPWLYDIGFEIIKKRSELKKDELTCLISDFKNIVNFSIDKYIYKTVASNKKEYISILKNTVNRIDLNKNKMIYLL